MRILISGFLGVLTMLGCKSERDKNHEKALQSLLVEEARMDSIHRIWVKYQDSTLGKEGLTRLKDSMFRARFYRNAAEAQFQQDVVARQKERVMLEK